MIIEIILLSIGLAMDAFTVSISKGMCINKFNIYKFFIIAFYFGFFQAFMPLIGYFLGSSFSYIINSFDHWIAFILLFSIGLNMAFDNDCDTKYNDDTNFKTMFILAVATSIDALTIGITLSLFNVNIILSVLIIGIITFILSYIGCLIGFIFKCNSSFSQRVGGFILMLIGLRILLDHLGFI